MNDFENYDSPFVYYITNMYIGSLPIYNLFSYRCSLRILVKHMLMRCVNTTRNRYNNNNENSNWIIINRTTEWYTSYLFYKYKRFRLVKGLELRQVAL